MINFSKINSFIINHKFEKVGKETFIGTFFIESKKNYSDNHAITINISIFQLRTFVYALREFCQTNQTDFKIIRYKKGVLDETTNKNINFKEKDNKFWININDKNKNLEIGNCYTRKEILAIADSIKNYCEYVERCIFKLNT